MSYLHPTTSSLTLMCIRKPATGLQAAGEAPCIAYYYTSKYTAYVFLCFGFTFLFGYLFSSFRLPGIVFFFFLCLSFFSRSLYLGCWRVYVVLVASSTMSMALHSLTSCLLHYIVVSASQLFDHRAYIYYIYLG